MVNKQVRRFQIIAESKFVRVLEDIAAHDKIRTKPHELPDTDQNFGLVEATAIIASVSSIAELALLIWKGWQETKPSIKVTVKTPKGEISVEGVSYKSTEELMSELKQYLE